MSLEPLRGRFGEVGLPVQDLERWFDRILRYGMALSLADNYVAFPKVAGSALRSLAPGRIGEDAVQHVLGGLAELPAHADVEPAMRVLADNDITMVCLSNGTARTTADFLRRCGLDGFVEQVISVAEVETWKPAARVYEHTRDRVACDAADIALVAVHAFDCHGARQAGFTTAWASRLEVVYPTVFAAPDVTGADLVEVARGLINLPAPI